MFVCLNEGACAERGSPVDIENSHCGVNESVSLWIEEHNWHIMILASEWMFSWPRHGWIKSMRFSIFVVSWIWKGHDERWVFLYQGMHEQNQGVFL